jgi:hypothetical protein
MENEEQRKDIAKNLINKVTLENVAEIHLKNFHNYLYENSDEVEINGKIYTNSFDDKFKKVCFKFPNEQGEPNIKTASACGTSAGFPITELYFIERELTILKDLSFSDFVQRKKYETYLNFIENKKTQLQIEPNFTNKPQQQIQENRIVSQIEHPFSSPRNFDLFKYLDEWFKPTAKKSKYTYIYNHFKDNNFEPLLSQNTYLEFVKKFKNIEMANRLQGAPSNKFDAEINRLVSVFEKLNS